MSRYLNLQDKSIPTKPLEQFDIKIFREKLNDKYGNSPIAKVHPVSKPQSPKKNNKQSLAYDTLQSKLRDFSSKQQQQQYTSSPIKQRIEQGSPSRAIGLSQKISQIGTFSIPLQQKSQRIGSQYNTSQHSGSVSDEKKYFSKRFDTECQERNQVVGFNQNTIQEMIPLHEIMNMRNKLENAQMNLNQISSTYTSEMVRLASVINTQLKKQQK